MTPPIGAQTLTLEQAAQRDILDKRGSSKFWRRATDVDEGAGAFGCCWCWRKARRKCTWTARHLVGDADGKRLETRRG